MHDNDRVLFVIMLAIIFVSVVGMVGFGVYKTEAKRQAYYDCLEYNKQIFEKTGKDPYNNCFMF